MWICANDSFLSIVEDRNDKNRVVVRARVREDLVAMFPSYEKDVIETDDSDYRFRLFLYREFVAKTVADRITAINYPNFKNSIRQSWRYAAYTKIWEIMYRVQRLNMFEKV